MAKRVLSRTIHAKEYPAFYDRLNEVLNEIQDEGFEIVNVSHSTVLDVYHRILFSAVVLYE